MALDGSVEKGGGSLSHLRNKIERTAQKRAMFTRRFLPQIGKSEREFAVQIKDLFDIDCDVKDDASLAGAVFDLQVALGFPQVISGKGCDGMFGPFTNRGLKQYMLRNKSRAGIKDVHRDVNPGVEDPEEPLDDVEKVVAEALRSPSRAEAYDSKIEKVGVGETAFIGDSLTVGMRKHISAAKSLYRGAMQTGWMRTQLDKFLSAKKRGRHSAVKRVVIFGGVNDIGSTKDVSKVINNLRYMYAAAKSAGLEVVACTIPDWNTDKFLRRVAPRWRKRGLNGGVYPLSSKELQQRTLAVNRWIMSQSGITVADLHTEMQDRRVYPRAGDGLHMTGKGYKAMAKYIKGRGNIGGGPEIMA